MFHRFIDQRDPDVFGAVGIDPGRAAVFVGDCRRDGSRPVDVVIDLQVSGIAQGRVEILQLSTGLSDNAGLSG